MFKALVEKTRNFLDPTRELEERRQVIRLKGRLLGQIRSDDGAKSSDAFITNLSLTGLRFDGTKKYQKGDRFQIGLVDSRAGLVTCIVVWVKTSGTTVSTGVRFDESKENLAKSWLKQTLLQLGFVPGKVKERRTYIRFPSPSTIRAVVGNRNGDNLTEGRLLNIGYGGALAGLEVELPIGAPVNLQLDPTLTTPPLDSLGKVRSVVRDVKKRVYITGIQFDTQGESQVKKYLKAVRKSLAKPS
jgi:hypothetical protein